MATLKSKPAWLESQYLFPHHFQQLERYFEARLEDRCGAIRPYVWGLRELTLDPAALAQSRLGLAHASGILPDGTPFALPDEATLPAPLKLAVDSRDLLVLLALPAYQPGTCHLDAAPGNDDRIARYRLGTLEVFDYCGDQGKSEQVETAEPEFRLLLEGQELGGYTAVPIARVREVTQDGEISLDPNFIPPSLDVLRQPRLSALLGDVLGLLKQRGDALALRFNHAGKSGGASAIADFLLLQAINRNETRLRHLASLIQLHPERFYTELCALAGELATFTTESKRPEPLPVYLHTEPGACFHPLTDILGRQLSSVLEQTAISMPVEERQFGIRVARIGDRSLLGQARFVLSAKADAPADALRGKLPALLKIGAVEQIRTLVNNQLPGIGVNLLPVAPREIPYHAGRVYFELDSESEHWQQLRQAGGFAFHVAGEFPRLELELWAIRR